MYVLMYGSVPRLHSGSLLRSGECSGPLFIQPEYTGSYGGNGTIQRVVDGELPVWVNEWR